MKNIIVEEKSTADGILKHGWRKKGWVGSSVWGMYWFRLHCHPSLWWMYTHDHQHGCHGEIWIRNSVNCSFAIFVKLYKKLLKCYRFDSHEKRLHQRNIKCQHYIMPHYIIRPLYYAMTIVLHFSVDIVLLQFCSKTLYQ